MLDAASKETALHTSRAAPGPSSAEIPFCDKFCLNRLGRSAAMPMSSHAPQCKVTAETEDSRPQLVRWERPFISLRVPAFDPTCS